MPRLGRYGTSNHFVPVKPFNTNLWPASWPLKVWRSDLGIGAMLGVLGLVASKIGGARLAMLYGAPYLFTNAWLVLYTWLQHTDVDVPHLTNDEFSYMRGAFLTVDRPYGRVFDWLHHKSKSSSMKLCNLVCPACVGRPSRKWPSLKWLTGCVLRVSKS